MGDILAVSAKLALLEGDPLRAAELIAFAEEFNRRHALPVMAGFRREMDGTVSRIREAASTSAVESAFATGRALLEDAALALALCRSSQ